MALSGGELNIQAQGVALELPKGLRSELDALVTFRPDPRSPSLTGDIRIVAERVYRNDHDRGAGAAGGAAGDGGSTVQRPYLERLQLNLARDDDRRHHRRQQLRPPGRRSERAGRRHGRAARPRRPHHACAKAGRFTWPAAPSGSRAATSRSPIAATSTRNSTSPPKPTSAPASGNVTMTLTGTLERPTIDLTSEERLDDARRDRRRAGRLDQHRNRADAVVGRSARRHRPRDRPRCVPRRARRLPRSATSATTGRPDADRQRQHRPDDPSDGGQAVERSGRVHGVAEPARERQGDVRRQLFPAPQHRAARAVARQRHGQPRHPPPGHVRRRRQQAAIRAARQAGRSPRSRSAASMRRSPPRCAPRSRSTKATSSISSSCRRTSIASARRSTSRASSKRACAPGAPKPRTRAASRIEFIDQPRAADDAADRRAWSRHRRLIERARRGVAQERLRSVPDRRPDASRPPPPRRLPATSAASWSARIDRPDAGHQAAADRQSRPARRSRAARFASPATSSSMTQRLDAGDRRAPVSRSRRGSIAPWSSGACARSTTRKDS